MMQNTNFHKNDMTPVFAAILKGIFTAVGYFRCEIVRCEYNEDRTKVKIQLCKVGETKIYSFTYSLFATDEGGNQVVCLRDLTPLLELSRILDPDADKLCNLADLVGMQVYAHFLVKTITTKEIAIVGDKILRGPDNKPSLVNRKRKIYAVSHYLPADEEEQEDY